MKKTCPLVFTSSVFHFSEIIVLLLIFSISFATLTYAHEPLKAQQTTAIMTPLEVLAVPHFIRLN